MKGGLKILFLTLFFSSCQGWTGFGRYNTTNTGAIYHIVKRGDSINSIAKRYSTNANSLIFLNGLQSGRGLYPGLKILVKYSLDPNYKISSNLNINKNEKRGLIKPIYSGRISSRFGKRWGKFHDGIDIAAPTGTRVYAAHAGKVINSGSNLSGYGKTIIIRRVDGLTTVYAHNSKLIAKLGENVGQGDLISNVGSTGRSTGPHLHFEIRVKREDNRYFPIDPEFLFK